MNAFIAYIYDYFFQHNIPVASSEILLRYQMFGYYKQTKVLA